MSRHFLSLVTLDLYISDGIGICLSSLSMNSCPIPVLAVVTPIIRRRPNLLYLAMAFSNKFRMFGSCLST